MFVNPIKALKHKLDRLDENLKYLYGDYSGREIAEMFNVSLGTVRRKIKEQKLYLGENRGKKVSKVFSRTLGKRFYYDTRGYRYIKISGQREREEHRVVIENILGRKLKTDETVHHIDGIKLNNNPENLYLALNKHHQTCHASLEVIAFELVRRGVIGFNRDDGVYFINEENIR